MEFVKKDIGRRLLLVNPVETNLPKMLKQVNPNYLAAVFGKFDWSPSATHKKYDEAVAFTHNSEDLNDPKSIFIITGAGLDFMERKVSETSPSS